MILKDSFYKKIYDMNIYIMKWIDASIDFNETKKNWVVPRKGTKAYIQTKNIKDSIIIKINIDVKIIEESIKESIISEIE